MMDMVFFPFSHVDPHQCRALTTVFPNFTYLPLAADLPKNSAMKPLVEKKAATPVFTSGDRLGQVESRVAAWLDWAALHKGNQRDLKSLARGGPYFIDDAGPGVIQSEIRARIRQDVPGNIDKSPPADPLLFLKIAQITDAHNAAIDAELAGLEKRQAALFSDLKGDPDPILPDTAQVRHRDPGLSMTGARIRAWSAFAGEENVFAGERPMVLITTSSAVFDYLAANSSRFINALDIGYIKVHEDGCVRRPEWQDHFLDILEKIVTEQYPENKAHMPEDLLPARDDCSLFARVQVGIFSGLALENHTGLPGKRHVVCRVAVKT